MGIYTGEVQSSEYAETLASMAQDGVGSLLYDKGEHAPAPYIPVWFSPSSRPQVSSLPDACVCAVGASVTAVLDADWDECEAELFLCAEHQHAQVQTSHARLPSHTQTSGVAAHLPFISWSSDSLETRVHM